MIFDRNMESLKHSNFVIINFENNSLESDVAKTLKPIIRDWSEESSVPPAGSPIEDPVWDLPSGGKKKEGKQPKNVTTPPPSAPGGMSATDLALQKLLQQNWDNNVRPF